MCQAASGAVGLKGRPWASEGLRGIEVPEPQTWSPDKATFTSA